MDHRRRGDNRARRRPVEGLGDVDIDPVIGPDLFTRICEVRDRQGPLTAMVGGYRQYPILRHPSLRFESIFEQLRRRYPAGGGIADDVPALLQPHRRRGASEPGLRLTGGELGVWVAIGKGTAVVPVAPLLLHDVVLAVENDVAPVTSVHRPVDVGALVTDLTRCLGGG